jgi:predicted RNase H-like HicB family nuclease
MADTPEGSVPVERHLPVEIERLEEGGYLASCLDVPGCHAEGRTIGEAIDNLRDVARVVYELCREKGLPFLKDETELPAASDLVWQLEFDPELEPNN